MFKTKDQTMDLLRNNRAPDAGRRLGKMHYGGGYQPFEEKSLKNDLGTKANYKRNNKHDRKKRRRALKALKSRKR